MDERHNSPNFLFHLSTECRGRSITRGCYNIRIDRRGGSVHPRRAIWRSECRGVRPSARDLLPHHSEWNILPSRGNNGVRSRRLRRCAGLGCDNVRVGAGPCSDSVGTKPGQVSVIASPREGPCICSGDGGPHVASPFHDSVFAWQTVAVPCIKAPGGASSETSNCLRGGSIYVGGLGLEVFRRKS